MEHAEAIDKTPSTRIRSYQNAVEFSHDQGFDFLYPRFIVFTVEAKHLTDEAVRAVVQQTFRTNLVIASDVGSLFAMEIPSDSSFLTNHFEEATNLDGAFFKYLQELEQLFERLRNGFKPTLNVKTATYELQRIVIEYAMAEFPTKKAVVERLHLSGLSALNYSLDRKKSPKKPV